MIRRFRDPGLAISLVAFVALAGGSGQPQSGTRPASAPPPPPASAPGDNKPRTTVTDLARAYLELDAAFTAAPVERELCRDVNTAFDDASKLFFAGDLARVVEIVDASAARLRQAASLGSPNRSASKADRSQGFEPEFALLMGSNPPPEISPRLLAIWNARRELLIKAEEPGSLESLVQEPDNLFRSLTAEARSIVRNENPYTNRRGDLWRPYFIADQPAPMRLFCPEHREPPAEGWPLVIALHGAGGNEHMFMSGYGAGRIRQLAEQHGFVVASPQNSPLSAQPAVLDALVESIAADYPIDRSRVYLIGHSMGAGVALAWSKLRHDRIAATALIAGVGRFNAKDTLPPTLLIAPELDGLIPARSIIAAAEQAKGFGLPVECREIKDYGHTLVVGHVLPDVIDWLLKQPVSPAPTILKPGANP